MTKKSAAGTRRPNAPKGDCWLESEAWASKASIGVGPSSTGRRVGPVPWGHLDGDTLDEGIRRFKVSPSRCPRFEAVERLLDVFFRGSGLDRVAQAAHEIEIKREVVEGVEAEGEQFLRGEQVA